MGSPKNFPMSRAIGDRGASERARLTTAPPVYRDEDFIVDDVLRRVGAMPPDVPNLPFKPAATRLKGWSGTYVFPVGGQYRFQDTWNAGRFNPQTRKMDKPHRGVDIFADEGAPVHAITDGWVFRLANWPYAGLTVGLKGNDGRAYYYMHLNSFDPVMLAKFGGLPATFYERRSKSNMRHGNAPVGFGDKIARVGRSGIGNPTTPAHLHFEAFPNHKFNRSDLQNPYAFLVELAGRARLDKLKPEGGTVEKVKSLVIENP